MLSAAKRRLNAIQDLGCCVCGAPAELHHVRRDGQSRKTAPVIPVCRQHHPGHGDGIGRETFEALYGPEEHYVEWVEEQLCG